MDHPEARDLLEVAAVEPGGLDRLMAGDTPSAAALAGHLAGCPDCTRLMSRLRRDAAVIAGVMRTTPPPGLRDRTLGYVTAVGRDRSVSPAGTEAVHAVSQGSRGGHRLRGPALVASLAAVLIVAIAGTAAIVDALNRQMVAERDARIARQAAIVAALSRVTTWTMRVESQPDARRIELTGAPGFAASGLILFSPTSRELVVVASGLAEPEPGHELRCWVEIDGRTEPVGRMFFGGELSYWAGPVETLGAAAPDARFGVSVVDAAGNVIDPEPVLSGRLRDG